ncbi:hypothetical protein D3C85_1258640 [compost metagenome]
MVLCAQDADREGQEIAGMIMEGVLFGVLEHLIEHGTQGLVGLGVEVGAVGPPENPCEQPCGEAPEILARAQPVSAARVWSVEQIGRTEAKVVGADHLHGLAAIGVLRPNALEQVEAFDGHGPHSRCPVVPFGVLDGMTA